MWFKREEINGGGTGPTYLIRWVLLRLWGGRAVYLHKFIDDDWARDPHDHPKDFLSIGLKGRYVEEIYDIDADGRSWMTESHWSAPWIRRFRADHIHRIRVPGDPAWTLVYVGPLQRSWGFFPRGGGWVHWYEYIRERRNERAGED